MTNLLRSPYNMLRPLYERTSFHQSVIEEVEDEELKKAYEVCRSMTRYHAKTFYMATRFLPNAKQRGIFAIYGLCRYIDDLVDEAEGKMLSGFVTREQVKNHLRLWQQKLIDTYNGRVFDDPILLAFSDILKSFNIPIRHPLHLMEGVGDDLYKRRYQNFEELYNYSYKVAATVGLMTSEVFGYSSKKALNYAVDLGIAMQLTNILRDVGEDLEIDRVYLPKEDLDRFGVTYGQLFARRIDDNFIRLIQFEIERTRSFYQQARKGISMLSRDSRLPVCLAHTNYARILNKIEKNDYNVFDYRAYLTGPEKLAVMPQSLCRLLISSIQ